MNNLSSIISHLLPITTTISASQKIHIANHSVSELVKQYSTPLYIFDRATIIAACKQYQQAFKAYYSAYDVQMLYASKTYISPLVAQIIAEQGFGLDIVSGGELAVAQRAGFPMERISFHGNNKSEAELRVVLKVGVGRIILDNWSEIERLARLAQELGVHPAVLLRVAPEVETDTHRYLQTGHGSSKFGFALKEAKAACKHILSETPLHLVGLHAHTGTMLREVRPYQECLTCLLGLANDRAENILFEIIEAEPANKAFLDQGRAFYKRLRAKSDPDLLQGNLSRTEVEEGLAQLEAKTLDK